MFGQQNRTSKYCCLSPRIGKFLIALAGPNGQFALQVVFGERCFYLFIFIYVRAVYGARSDVLSRESNGEPTIPAAANRSVALPIHEIENRDAKRCLPCRLMCTACDYIQERRALALQTKAPAGAERNQLVKIPREAGLLSTGSVRRARLPTSLLERAFGSGVQKIFQYSRRVFICLRQGLSSEVHFVSQPVPFYQDFYSPAAPSNITEGSSFLLCRV